MNEMGFTPRSGYGRRGPSPRERPARWRARLLIAAGMAVIMVAATPGGPAAKSGPRRPVAQQLHCGLTELVCTVADGEGSGAGGTCPEPSQSCDLDLTLYRIYMARLSKGAKMRPLHPRYRAVLSPYYPELDLSRVRLGYSPRQPLRNATTDCLNIYFNDATAVEHFATGRAKIYFKEDRPDPDSTHLDWLLHELRHAEQCMEEGGREGYARRWFIELSRSGMLLLKGSSQQLHDAMGMEEDAEAVAQRLLERLTLNVDARGDLVPEIVLQPPVRVGPLRVAAPLPVIFSVAAAGGSEPLSFTWSMKRPGRDQFYRVPELEGRTWRNQLVWTPSLAGIYQIRVQASHPGGRLEPAIRIYQLNVAPAPKRVCSATYTM